MAGKAAAKKIKANLKVKTEQKAFAAKPVAAKPVATKPVPAPTKKKDEEQDEDDCSAKPCQKPLGLFLLQSSIFIFTIFLFKSFPVF